MKKSMERACTLAFVLLMSAGAFNIWADSGVLIEHLGTNNTLVRIIDPAKFIILPVQESSDEAAVNVIVYGKLERTINVRLAKSKVDYTVPLNIEKYAGKNVQLNVITSQGRSSIREAKNDACWRDICVADSFDTSNREKFRPLYHHAEKDGKFAMTNLVFPNMPILLSVYLPTEVRLK